MTPEQLNNELSRLVTEQRNPASMQIDSMDVSLVLRLINSEDKKVANAVEKEIPYIADAVDAVLKALRSGGRLIYVGAGTSGRLGVIDAAECPPTFGTSVDEVVGIIAGGPQAVFVSQEGAEDNTAQALSAMNGLKVTKSDVVCGIAASKRTPYVVAALERARTLRARTILVTTNPRSELDITVDVAICPEVGPEVLMGSTRMKSGTAQKLVLNMITTTAMIRLGKVYQNMMVDLQLTNQKLVERAKRIIMMTTGVDYERASVVLKESEGHVKTAILMIKCGLELREAKELLSRANGFVNVAIELAG